ncbi:hypothetical protein BDA96_02G195300 [Sorghum bicolor]|uniref:Trehalose 6-phosphate phosphatase n=1 Tax=Sorghum bicolor TaxID=4558 RepID=A0A921RMY7_SORBI|nr:hypothetical protein BDA96_02G195300 [Sorghum bicolor]
MRVHFRCVEEAAWAPLFEQVHAVLRDYPGLCLTQGRKVLEVRPMIRWDKGKALEFLLTALSFANAADKDVFLIYVGDDRTDEDAFRVLRAQEQGARSSCPDAPRDFLFFPMRHLAFGSRGGAVEFPTVARLSSRGRRGQVPPVFRQPSRRVPIP